MKIGIFSILRIAVGLRQIRQSLDRLVAIEQNRLDLELEKKAKEEVSINHQRWLKSQGRTAANPRPSIFDVADPSEWNQNYKKEHPFEEEGR